MKWIALALVLLASVGPLAAPAQVPRPDVVILLTDDMAASDWRVLDETVALVAGTWFPHFVYPTPLCCPTRATLFRGQYAHNHGVRENDPGWPAFRPLEAESLAPALDALGYQTALFGTYLNGYDGATVPPGWDAWDADDGGGHDKYRWEGGYHTDVLARKAAAFLAAADPHAPVFLVVSYRAPHSPAEPAARHRNADVDPVANDLDRTRKRTLLAVDEANAAIAAAMGDRWPGATVFVLSDNGYPIGGRGAAGRRHWGDETTRVPLLARIPGVPSGTDGRLAATPDLAATVLRAAGVEPTWVVDGRPLQEPWERTGVLLESWDTANDGRAGKRFVGIKGRNWVYVVPEGEAPRYYELPGEAQDVHGRLSAAEQGALAAWLADAKDCASAADCG